MRSLLLLFLSLWLRVVKESAQVLTVMKQHSQALDPALTDSVTEPEHTGILESKAGAGAGPSAWVQAT